MLIIIELISYLIMLQDRAKNPADRFSSTTTMTVNVKDDDDQDPSFIYQGCPSQGGACINPEYYASVSTLHYQQIIIIKLFR